MSEINNLSLKIFAEILRSGSFEAAAKKLHITPSAVSQRIKQLEEQLGQLLIVRGIPSRPTDVGKKLFRHAQQIQSVEDDFFNELNQNTNYKISVAVNMDSMDGWFFDAITESANLGIILNLKVEDQQFTESLLREGKVMAAVSTNSRTILGCSTEFLGTMHYTAYASVLFCKQFFSQGDRVKSLIASPAICFNEKDGLQHTFVKLVAGGDIEPVTMFIPSNAAYVEAILRGLGWGMLPDFISERLLRQEKIVKLFPGTSIAVNLYWIRWNTKIPSLDKLSVCVRNAAQKHLKVE